MLFDPIYLIILFGFMFLSMGVGGRLKRKFKKYSTVPTSSGMSGAEVAQKMLRDNNIYDVTVKSVRGELTDHYNPAKKTINLSEEVYHGRHVAAAAVAAHETGHAVQHATAYSMLELRSKLVPVVNIASRMMNYIFIGMLLLGIFLANSWNIALILIVAAQGALALFSLVTLPVEFDASNRALAWLNMSRVTMGQEHDYAKDALKWAAMTYVVSALAAITTLLYWVMVLTGGSRD